MKQTPKQLKKKNNLKTPKTNPKPRQTQNQEKLWELH